MRRETVLAALREASWDVDAAANLLGVSPRSVYRYMERWRLDARE